MIEFYTSFNEFKLQGLLKGQALDILTELRNEYRRRKNDNYDVEKVSEKPFEVLFKHYSQLSLLMNDDDYFNVDFDVRDGIEKKSDEYIILSAKMYNSVLFSFYFNNLVQKARTKVFYYLFKYPGRIIDHTSDNEDYKLTFLVLYINNRKRIERF